MKTRAKSVKLPAEPIALSELRAGESVLLQGRVYTGRDRLHKFFCEGGESPVDLQGAALYHCGPVVVPEGDDCWRVVAAGPTTSIREEPYMAQVMRERGVRVVIGKGGMGDETLKACQELGAVYLQAVGGAAALLAQCIRSVEDVYFLDEFGATEAMWAFEVVDFPAIVAMDCQGESLYAEVNRLSQQKLQQCFAEEK